MNSLWRALTSSELTSAYHRSVALWVVIKRFSYGTWLCCLHIPFMSSRKNNINHSFAFYMFFFFKGSMVEIRRAKAIQDLLLSPHTGIYGVFWTWANHLILLDFSFFSCSMGQCHWPCRVPMGLNKGCKTFINLQACIKYHAHHLSRFGPFSIITSLCNGVILLGSSESLRGLGRPPSSFPFGQRRLKRLPLMK